ncbi:MAG: hypothetical protein FJX72_05020, partial [Armatimonadetes bacterium]|nr:hypothetical protein [Armatimonadota bacterium]
MTALAVLLTLASSAGAAPWHHPLCLGNGGLWRQRAAVVVANSGSQAMSGTPVTVPIGVAQGSLSIVGADAKSLRVCNERGDEMLYALTDDRGVSRRTGRIAPSSTLTIQVECSSGAEARYYVYFDNTSAWAPPDHLEATGDLRNGSVEDGKGDAPDGWVHDAPDSGHKASWTHEAAHSGRRSLKLRVADGAEPTWISTRQSGIRLSPGARYRVTAWVKAEGVKGMAGWYIHIGNAANTMMDAPMLSAGEGTFAWKSVTLEFTAPPGADRASLGTVLRGTGVAWFDDVSLERLDEGESYTVRALPPERIGITELGRNEPWPTATRAAAGETPAQRLSRREAAATRFRAPMRVMNSSDEPLRGFVSVEASSVLRSLQSRMRDLDIRVVHGGKEATAFRLGSNLLFEARVPARTAAMWYAYPTPRAAAATVAPVAGETPALRSLRTPIEYAPNPAVPGGVNRSAADADLAQYAALAASPLNLAKNGGFEEGTAPPDAWIGGAEGERPANAEMGVVGGGLFGRRCGRIHVPHTSTPAWTGWRQDVPVTPGRSYLFAVWLRCEGLNGGIQIHAHLRTASGELAKQNAMVGAGPAIAGTTGWTLLAGTFRTPEDCRVFQMHLTMLATGTAWHDGVLLVEVSSAEALPHQVRSEARSAGVSVWPVNPIVKVFREDTPPTGRTQAAKIICAGNEYEPLQLAVRSVRSVQSVRIVVDKPRSNSGLALKEVETGTVGYVPIDA